MNAAALMPGDAVHLPEGVDKGRVEQIKKWYNVMLHA